MVLLWEFSGVGTMVPLPVAARLRACTQTGFDLAGSQRCALHADSWVSLIRLTSSGSA